LVAATDKSFSDVREKHLKLIGEDEKKKIKELPNKNGSSKSSKIEAINLKKSNIAEQKSFLAKTKNVAPKTTSSPFVKRYGVQPPAQTSSGRENVNEPSLKIERDDKNKEIERPKEAFQKIPKISPTVKSSIDQLKTLSTEKNEINKNLKSSSLITDLIGGMDTLEILIKPSRDWSTWFTEIQNESEAQEYRDIFHTEYPVYKKCYDAQYKISRELLDLKAHFDNAINEGQNNQQIFNDILMKTSRLRHDKEFLSQRQQHYDFNAKLKVLGSRISEWQSKNVMSKTNMYCDSNFDL